MRRGMGGREGEEREKVKCEIVGCGGGGGGGGRKRCFYG
jgi:hypothetical protein